MYSIIVFKTPTGLGCFIDGIDGCLSISKGKNKQEKPVYIATFEGGKEVVVKDSILVSKAPLTVR